MPSMALETDECVGVRVPSVVAESTSFIGASSSLTLSIAVMAVSRSFLVSTNITALTSLIATVGLKPSCGSACRSKSLPIAPSVCALECPCSRIPRSPWRQSSILVGVK